MITNSREKGLQAKLEGGNSDNELGNHLKASSSSSSRQWAGFRNPRIVRVSRSFGGKDRHSKVCTIRGLRDRRIRLSVPTAVQLYDLQDRLGLNQPSKVIDWLLEATKNDIDKLPPLQIPQGFGQFHQQMRLPHESISNPSQPSHLASFFDGSSTNFMFKDIAEHPAAMSSAKSSKFWDLDAALMLKAKGKEFERGANNINIEEKGEEEENQDHGIGSIGGGFGGQLFAQKFFTTTSHSSTSLPAFLNNAMAYNYYHSEPSNLSLSQFGNHGFPISQLDHGHHQAGSTNALPFSSSSMQPLASGSSQLFFCPPTATPTAASLFGAPNPYPASVESDPRQINYMLPNSLMPNSLHSSTLPFKPFPSILNPKLHSQSTEEKGHSGS
ncbi:hypothetical protein FNV43_RR20810 [Rhamnella rubrinervis]|uniref:TCP domain-containing protein n=1 Tax=Rhamnella rubrinervis TaxID=2594499 RepID=A0A8K0GTR6_9ROSA|nr:hypothetical protein FNV43_RR20810 [Rhamnella rubrinervis]